VNVLRPSRAIALAASLWLAPLQGGAPAPPREIAESYPSGAVKVRYSLDDDGRRNGPYSEYFEDGRVKIRTAYRAGELEGAYEAFDPKGAVLQKSNYQKGLLHGSYYEKSEDGVREVKAAFRGGKKHGAVEVLEKRKRVSIQEWKQGALLTIDGIEPYPNALEAILDELKKIEELTPEGFDKMDPRVRALRRLQQYRFLCGVPYEGMLLDPTMNELCAAGAKLCKAIGRLDHTPPNPGWPDAEYRRAYEGTSHSNLSMGANMQGSVDSYMDDSDPGNVGRVGHRRWCLNPRMLRTGFGIDGVWTAMWSMDASRSKVPPIDFVAYPARGYMPREYFRRNVAWSISSATGKYAARSKDKVKIVVRALDDWYAPTGEPYKLVDVNIEAGGYGGSPCLIFRPVSLGNEAGKKYWTEISTDGDDAPEVRYLTEFVSVKP
jgi:hypothetical protein